MRTIAIDDFGVCQSVTKAKYAKRLNGSTFCAGWRLLETKETLYYPRRGAARGSIWPSANYFNDLLVVYRHWKTAVYCRTSSGLQAAVLELSVRDC